MDEVGVKHVARQLYSFLQFLHEKQIAHRDIKPDNIMINKIDDTYLHLKVIDFGFAESFKHNKKFSQVLGSVHYMAPEVLLENGYDYKVDVWSATIIIYILLCEELPFFGASSEEIYHQICHKELDVSSYKWEGISDEAKDFLKLGLNKDCSKRPNCAEMLSHEWLSDNSPLTNYLLDNLSPIEDGLMEEVSQPSNN